ncbi:hypothetical protein Q8A67_018998 [Cirrhinus molitorella]|uniref:Uncharacterized protein n=1 Tax=Cirrhinus molitorella TaxID=172907 RepID=A0AA88TRA7_9TELE|nr:hypothetical protein Q8A67_018998 [Cirrhinus molitorella]
MCSDPSAGSGTVSHSLAPNNLIWSPWQHHNGQTTSSSSSSSPQSCILMLSVTTFSVQCHDDLRLPPGSGTVGYGRAASVRTPDPSRIVPETPVPGVTDDRGEEEEEDDGVPAAESNFPEVNEA